MCTQNKQCIRVVALLSTIMIPPAAVSSFSASAAKFMAPSASSALSALEQVRSLSRPSREGTLRRDPSVTQFWQENALLLGQAWREWSDEQELSTLDDSIFDRSLREAIQLAWNDPSQEYYVRELWEEVVPGVYQTQFFNPEKLSALRTYIDQAADSGIPARAPYGIVLNRKGFMLDPNSIGYLAVPEFRRFYKERIMDTYMRPLGRLFFPEYVQEGDDDATFGFPIQYQAGMDQSMRQHTDASSVTLNINLNLPSDDEKWTGSSLQFVDPSTGERHSVDFAPGVAVMHRGQIPHVALPIESGERSNMVLWLYGSQGISRYPYPEGQRMSPKERWRNPGGRAEQCWTPF